MDRAVVRAGGEMLVEGESSVLVSELGEWGLLCDRKAI